MNITFASIYNFACLEKFEYNLIIVFIILQSLAEMYTRYNQLVSYECQVMWTDSAIFKTSKL